MNEVIKSRIEQIRRGEVPERYKKTKVGIVPAEWAVIKLSKVLRKQTTKNTNNAIHNVLTNSATQGIVNQTDFFDKQIANDDNTSGYYVVNNGCFVYNPRISSSAPCGPFNRYNGQESGIMSPLYVVYDFVGESQAYSDYLSLYFASSKWHSYMNSIANYGARSDRMNVTSESMNNMPLPFPPLPEQEKIAEILTAQERVIELYEKKIEQLKNLKKAFLQKMFPKPGCNVPEWRFPEFTDAWEQRKLGDILKVKARKNGNSYTKEDVLSVSDEYGCVNQIHFQGRSFAGEDISNYKIVYTGDIVYTRSPLQAKPFGIIKHVGVETGIVSPLYIVNETAEGYDSKFVYYTFDSPQKTNNYLRPLVRKGAKNTMNISDDEWLSGEIMVTTSIEEQRHIGVFLETLDNLITLHQRKCDEEKQKKRALMQLLLTGIARVKYDE